MAEFINPFAEPSSEGFVNPFATDTPETEEKDKPLESIIGLDFEGSTGKELIEGLASGVLGAAEGVAGLYTTTSDLITGEDTTTKLNQSFQEFKDDMGIDPEGFAGTIGEVTGQFIIPGLGVAGAVAKGSKAVQAATKAKRALTAKEKKRLFLQEGAALIGTEAVVSNDNNTVVFDVFDSLPQDASDLIGETGTDKALLRFAKRAQLGLEAGAFGAAANLALAGIGTSLGQAKKSGILSKLMPGKLQKGLSNLGTKIEDSLVQRMTAEPGQEVGTFKNKLLGLVAASRYGGFLPRAVAEKQLLVDSQVRTAVSEAERNLAAFDRAAKQVFKQMPKELSKTESLTATNNLYAYLTNTGEKGAEALAALPKELRDPAVKMADQRNALAQSVKETPFISGGFGETEIPGLSKTINDVLDEGAETYLRKEYKIFQDSKYVPDDDTLEASRKYFKSNLPLTEKMLADIAKRDVTGEVFTPDFIQRNNLTLSGEGDTLKVSVGGKATDEVAKKATNAFLDQYRVLNRSNVKRGGGRVAKDRLDTGILMQRKDFSPVLKRLMGEVTDPREAYLKTVADLAQFTAVDDMYSTINRMAKNNDGIGKLFISPDKVASKAAQEALKNKGYVQLGGEGGVGSMVGPAVVKNVDQLDELVSRSGWGSLDGYYVPEDIYNSLTNKVWSEADAATQVAQGALNAFVRGKALSQYAKTILSPVTLVRNFTTSHAFMLANGNLPYSSLGRGTSSADAFRVVAANISKGGDERVLELLKDAQQRGVIGTNAELREIQDALRTGIDRASDAPATALEGLLGKKIAGSSAAKVLKKGLGGGAYYAEGLYQGGDDVMKMLSYAAEEAKLAKALSTVDEETARRYLMKNEAKELKDASMEELLKNRAAQIVRDTLPNYTKGASELVKFGRRLPFGNFITFPAEILRTGFNIVQLSLDDMASDIKAIQARGRSRLMSFGATTIAAPVAAVEAAYQFSGVDREEMDAYKRSFATSWEKGAVLVPLGKTKDGNLEYINYSTLNPYDTLTRFMNRAMNEGDKAIAQGQDPTDAVTNVVFSTMGEFFAPFMDEAIVTEAAIDVYNAATRNNGRTKSGAQIFNSQDNNVTKAWKSTMHVVDTIMPGFSPVDLKGGGFQAGRFTRGLLGVEGEKEDIFGGTFFASEDPFGRQRTLGRELLRAGTGVTTLEFDPKKGLEFGSYRFQRGQTESKQMFNRVADDFGTTGEQFVDAFIRGNEAKLRNDKRYYQMFEDLRAMGLSDSEMRKILKQNNIGSSARKVMRGQFDPFKVSSKNRKEIRRAGTQDEFKLVSKRINEIRKLMRGASLAPDDDPGARNPDITTQLEEVPATPSFVNPFAELPAPVSPSTPSFVNPFASIPTLPTLPPGPTVLPNPQDQEIQRRLNP
jgi:hypothetical protein